MTFESRLAAAMGILARTGMPRPVYAPPMHRLFWQVGIRVRPPHFAGRWSNFAWLWPVLSVSMLGLSVAFSGHGLARNLWDAGSFGAWFGFATGLMYENAATRLGLPRWEQVESPDQPFGPPEPPPRRMLHPDPRR